MWNRISAFVTVSPTLRVVVNSTTLRYSRVTFRNNSTGFHDEE